MFPDAALFDMDGLLLDSERLSLQAFLETSRRSGMDERPEVFHRLIGSNEQAILEILRQALSDQVNADEFRSDWSSRYQFLVNQQPVPLMPGVTEVLDWLSANGVRCAVATSSHTSLARSKLSHAGILERFEAVIGGDQVEKSKPDPEIYLRASHLLGVDPGASVGFEDSNNGVRSAVAAGLFVIQVPDLVPPSVELLKLGHAVCNDMHGALALLKARC